MVALSGRPAASGRSSGWMAVGSYSCFCSRANMLLFLTRDCFLRFSIELRLGERGELTSNSFSDVSKRLLGDVVCSFQNRRGLLVKGDESRKGELSFVRYIFWGDVSFVYAKHSDRAEVCTHLGGLVPAGRVPAVLVGTDLRQRTAAALCGRASRRLVDAQRRHLAANVRMASGAPQSRDRMEMAGGGELTASLRDMLAGVDWQQAVLREPCG
mgnify:CR=1 FL=1